MVINEVVTATTAASDEWVEVYNPCTSDQTMAGWTLVYRSSAGTYDVTMYTWATGSIVSHGYALIVGTGYSGSVPADDVFSTGGLAAAGGGLELRDATTTPVDGVGWGSATNAFVEGTAAPEPPQVAPPGNSIARMPNGQDTDNNQADFAVATTPTPKTSND